LETGKLCGHLCISHVCCVIFAHTDIMWLIFSFVRNSMTLILRS